MGVPTESSASQAQITSDHELEGDGDLPPSYSAVASDVDNAVLVKGMEHHCLLEIIIMMH